ncbi:helix-turn-helix domain-containing protein [Caballeronia sp. RCC_10]|uniref:helix-turn-helix domain-containing protein n=1 Tax=Caballeronia sp. RCC_10 TaxID=3239227 RepID=UPI003524C6CD
MIVEFDSSVVQTSQRLDRYLDLICHLYPYVDCAHVEEQGETFHASIYYSLFGQLGVGSIAAPGLHYVRTASAISRDNGDEFVACLLNKGSAIVEQNGRQAKQGPGDIVICDTARSYKYIFSSDYQLVCLRIPRKQMLCRLADAERLTALTLNGASPMGLFAGSVVRGAAGLSPTLELSAASKLASSVIDIIAASIETELGGLKAPRDRHVEIWERAKDHIDANLSDPEFNVDCLCDAIGVSRRTLNRVFAIHGTTAVRCLWQKRLDASHALLAEGRARHIADVAAACGFSDFSHFSRAFKKSYGFAPYQLLKQKSI